MKDLQTQIGELKQQVSLDTRWNLNTKIHVLKSLCDKTFIAFLDKYFCKTKLSVSKLRIPFSTMQEVVYTELENPYYEDGRVKMAEEKIC